MAARVPPDDWHEWSKLCCAFLSAGKSIGEVEDWCRKNPAKYHASEDRRFLEKQVSRGYKVRIGYAINWARAGGGVAAKKSDGPPAKQKITGYHRGKQEEAPRRPSPENGGLEVSFWDQGMFPSEIASPMELEVETVKKHLREIIKDSDLFHELTGINIEIGGGGGLLVIRRLKNDPCFFDACRYFRLERELKWISRKTGVPVPTLKGWKCESGGSAPSSGIRSQEAKRRILKEQRKAEREARRAAKPTPKPKSKIRVRALVSESERRGEYPKFYSEKKYRKVVGWWNGDRLEIDGEKTRKGRVKTKLACSVVWTWRVDVPEPKKGQWVFGSEEPGPKKFYS